MERIIGLTRSFSSHFVALQQNFFKNRILFDPHNSFVAVVAGVESRQGLLAKRMSGARKNPGDLKD